MNAHQLRFTVKREEVPMKGKRGHCCFRLSAIMLALVGAVVLTANVSSAEEASTVVIDTGSLAAIGRVDERYLSYNVESVEVTGGNFWAPYPKPGETSATYDIGPHGAGFSTNQYRRRQPLDLIDNERLRYLTRALGPAYMRVSGTWANSIFFQNNDKPAMDPPEGYQGLLTRAQWVGVVDFSKAVDAKILTSFAVSDGARSADGAWKPEQARQLFEYTASLGGSIDAVELMNEPNVRPKPYTPDGYARDHAALQEMVAEVSPKTLLVGPSSTGEAGFKLFPNPPEQMSTARLLSGNPKPKFDVFSHHFYGAVSQRCKSLGERDPKNVKEVTTSVDEALSESWLSRADKAQTFYKGMRDRFAPGSPIWITETAQAACGGDPWSAFFVDTFRFVDQLGRLAKQDVDMVFHNTLAASDYALIDDRTWLPRPNYWAALLWRRLMGEVVLDAGGNREKLHVYAHCLRDQPGVGLVVINLDRSIVRTLEIDSAVVRYTLSSDELLNDSVMLNGKPLLLTEEGELPRLEGVPVDDGKLLIQPLTVSFLVVKDSGNEMCSDVKAGANLVNRIDAE